MRKYVRPSVVITELEDIITTSEVTVFKDWQYEESQEPITMNLDENHLGSIDYSKFKSTN